MRVALDIRVLQQALRNSPRGGLGGPGRYVQGLVRALLARDDEIVYLLLVDRGPVPAELTALTHGGRVSLLPIGFKHMMRWLRFGRFGTLVGLLEAPVLARQIRAARADLVHIPDQPPPPFSRGRALVTLHDLAPFLEEAGASKRGLSRALQLHQLARAVKSAGAVVCVSESTAADAERCLRVSRDRLIVSYPGVDTSVFRPATTNGRGQNGSQSRFFLHVGVLRGRKNPEGLLRAFGELATDFGDVHLVCVGPYQVAPDVEARVRELAERAHVVDRVHLRRVCNDEELAVLYQEAVGLVFPSFYEGFGFPVVEALACGAPCVVARTSALPEVGGDLALYVDPADHRSIASAMRRLLVDPELRARARTDGPRWATRFTWEKGAETMAALYERNLK